jgi:hypothetical protein
MCLPLACFETGFRFVSRFEEDPKIDEVVEGEKSLRFDL